jgi:tetratricopeptide (TPR) repeat protein
MINRIYLVTPIVLLLGACANPLNRVTSDNYAETCATAEQNGRLEVAEQSCYRALVNVDMGNLGPELKSQRLYNLGRIKRKLGKFGEADSLFKQSIEIEETLTDPSSEKVGRRLAELAISYAQQKRISEGVPIVQRLSPIADSYSGAERRTVGAVFYGYAEELKKLGQEDLARQFFDRAKSLGFTP